MSKVLSYDLRIRVLKAVSEGTSHRAAAARFGVSTASVSRWHALEQRQGHTRAGPLGGDRRSARVEAQGALIRELLDKAPDLAIEELRAVLAERAHSFGYGTIQRFFRRHRNAHRRPRCVHGVGRRRNRLWAGRPRADAASGPSQPTCRHRRNAVPKRRGTAKQGKATRPQSAGRCGPWPTGGMRGSSMAVGRTVGRLC